MEIKQKCLLLTVKTELYTFSTVVVDENQPIGKLYVVGVVSNPDSTVDFLWKNLAHAKQRCDELGWRYTVTPTYVVAEVKLPTTPDLKSLISRWSKNLGRGVFIAFEGMDFSGKTTQARQLAVTLGAEFTFEPNDSDIRDMVLNSNMEEKAKAYLFCADRVEHSAYIKQQLTSGITVICDRYLWSGYAYNRGTIPDSVIFDSACRVFPDVTIYLKTTENFRRGSKLLSGRTLDKYEEADTNTQKRREYIFDSLAAGEPSCLTVNGTMDRDSVRTEIEKQLIHFIEKKLQEQS